MTTPDDLMQALFLRLKTDASLSALLGGIGLLESASDKAAFPNVTYGRTSAFDLETGADDDSDQLVTFHIWSKAQGEAETRLIMDSIRSRLDGAAFSIGSRDRPACRWNSPKPATTRTLRSIMDCCASAR